MQGFNVNIGIAGKAMVSSTALAWLGNGDVRPRTNSSMVRDPDVKSATGRARVARRSPRATIFINYTGSQSTIIEVVFVVNETKKISFVYWNNSNYSRSDVTDVFGSKDASSILSLSDWGKKFMEV